MKKINFTYARHNAQLRSEREAPNPKPPVVKRDPRTPKKSHASAEKRRAM